MDISDTQFWMVICGFIIAFVLAFGIGANDVANSFGTSVGSKVLTLKQACILATIFEILGSILIGAKVSGTIRKGILDPMIFQGAETELMLGYVSALLGCCVWLILATILNYPVSGTHSIVGATIGMAIVSRGFKVIKWWEIGKIVLSWFISPLLSGVVSLLMFLLIRRFILRARNPLTAGLKFLPFIYTITIFINIGGVLESSPPLLGFDKIPWWGKLIMIVALSIAVYLGIWLIMVPIMKRKVEKQMALLASQHFDEIDPEIDNEKIQLCITDEKGVMQPGGSPGANNKCCVSTQVDYVALIMAKNNQDFEDEYTQQMKKTNKLRNSSTTEQKNSTFVSNQQTDSLLQVHQSGSITGNTSSIQKGKKGAARSRAITAPASQIKEIVDYGDVNLTLRGYLHTIHTPAMRQQLLKNSSRSVNQPRDRLGSIGKAASNSSMNTAVAAIGGGNANAGGVSLTKIFSQQKSITNTSNATATEHRQSTPGGEKEAAEKRGRFNLAPAKLSIDSSVAAAAANGDNSALVEALIAQQREIDEQMSLVPNVAVKKQSTAAMTAGSMSDLDDDVEENICEMPAKKGKKPLDVDAFAHADPPEAARLFSFLQVLTAIFGSFAHGGNDVSNAIGPLIGLYMIYQDGQIKDKSSTPEWILFYGGVGISVGLWILGRRVIKTIGEDLTKITASSGFVIELASAMTVLGASLVNIPVSTTHCKVGSVVFTGRIRSKESVDWSLFRNIIIAWIVTVPVTGSIAGCCQYILKLIFIPTQPS